MGWVCGSTKKHGGICKANEIPEPILRRECAKALGLDEFDEGLFSERVERIIVPEQGIMEFHFKDGTILKHSWVNTSKKECWTDEYRAMASEYRRNHPAKRKGSSCFTTKIKCAHCGCNYRKQTSKAQYGENGIIAHWRCAEHKGCGGIGIEDSTLRKLCATVLGHETFDEDDFLERIDSITVSEKTHLEFRFKDETTATAEYVSPTIPRPPHTEEQKEHMREIMKEKWTDAKRRKMSENMKRMRKEESYRWHKEK